jgi:hypothetical protein
MQINTFPTLFHHYPRGSKICLPSAGKQDGSIQPLRRPHSTVQFCLLLFPRAVNLSACLELTEEALPSMPGADWCTKYTERSARLFLLVPVFPESGGFHNFHQAAKPIPLSRDDGSDKRYTNHKQHAVKLFGEWQGSKQHVCFCQTHDFLLHTLLFLPTGGKVHSADPVSLLLDVHIL